MENIEYYTRRLQCSDAEKDACLETLVKLYRLHYDIRRDGPAVAEVLAEEEADPFFRACLMDFWDGLMDQEELERRYTQYLMAGDYHGGAFLNAILISRGLVLLARYHGVNEEEWRWNQSWDEVLRSGLRGYFGVEYREKVTEIIRQEKKARVRQERRQKKDPSLLPEFDDLIKLSPQQRNWLVRQFSNRTWCLALKAGGFEVSEFLMEGMENREEFERLVYNTTNVRAKEVEAAQREILAKAANLVQSDAGTI